MKKGIVLALVGVLAFASGALADKTLTFFTMGLSDVYQVCFNPNAAAANGWTASAQARVRASAGPGYVATISGNVTAAQRTAIENYINTHVLPALNTQEGL